MSDKRKAFLSIFAFALCLFLMIETKYLYGSNGLHLTVLFFGILSFISFQFVRRYARRALKMKSLSIVLSVIVLVTSFSLITSVTAQYLKSQSDGLSAVALINKNNNKNNNFNTLHYETREFDVTDFEMDLTLKNYGKKEVSFFIEIDPLMFKDEPVEKLEIRNKDGSKAEFILKPGTTQRFVITDDMYQLTGGLRGNHSGYNLSINEVILSNKQGETVLLSDHSIIAKQLIHK